MTRLTFTYIYIYILIHVRLNNIAIVAFTGFFSSFSKYLILLLILPGKLKINSPKLILSFINELLTIAIGHVPMAPCDVSTAINSHQPTTILALLHDTDQVITRRCNELYIFLSYLNSILTAFFNNGSILNYMLPRIQPERNVLNLLFILLNNLA